MNSNGPSPRPDQPADAEEQLRLRLHGPPGLPVLIYLPGLHGDWTLITSFRRALAGRVQFVDMTYPRTLSWSLEDYAEAIEQELARLSIHQGWILGESFGSQIVWPLLRRQRFRAEGVVLAGGFGRHPMNWGVRLAERMCIKVSPTLLTRALFLYARVSRWRYRHAPEVLDTLDEFIARRTDLDRLAARHRLRLIAESDPCEEASRTRVPLYVITGFFDPIVPWGPVRSWLRRHCPALRQCRIVGRADHNVLGTAPKISADQVVAWMRQNG